MAKTDDKRKPNQGGGKTIFMGGAGKKPQQEKIPVGKPPKVDSKSYEEITAFSRVDLPKNQVRPVNGRIFAMEVDPGEMKTAGGLYLPTRYTKSEAKGNQEIKVMRYFVIDVADDCTIRFIKTANSTACKIERGDEVFPFFPDIVDFKFPTVHDFYNGFTYTVFHETELGGVGVSSLIEKEKE